MEESTIKNIQATMALHGFYSGAVDGKWSPEAHSAFYRIVEAAISKQGNDKVMNKVDTSPPHKLSNYLLSEQSLQKLSGVNADLQKVVKRAIQITEMDFAVNEGLRTIERQRQLVKSGASQTLKSNHLTGRAVDLVPTPNGGAMDWNNWDNYYPIVLAMQKAAEELNVIIKWGGCWEVINGKKGKPKGWVNAYGDRQRAKGKRPFTDGPHFELA